MLTFKKHVLRIRGLKIGKKEVFNVIGKAYVHENQSNPSIGKETKGLSSAGIVSLITIFCEIFIFPVHFRVYKLFIGFLSRYPKTTSSFKTATHGMKALAKAGNMFSITLLKARVLDFQQKVFVGSNCVQTISETLHSMNKDIR